MKRREFLKAAGASTAVVAMAPAAIAQASGKTFLVCTGAWSAGWSWKKHPLMAAAGHRLPLRPTPVLAKGSTWRAHQTISKTHIRIF